MKKTILFCLGLALWPRATASAQHPHPSSAPCQEAVLRCAAAATPAFAPDGTLWLVWAAGGRVMVGHSPDLGRNFDRITPVNREAEQIDSGPDARPKLVIDRNGNMIVAYAVFMDDRYNGRVMVSRSTDGGASFRPPQPITVDTTSQRFETLAIDPDGNLFAAWIDKRNAAAAKAAGKPYAGAALAYSWSSDDGQSFGAAQIGVALPPLADGADPIFHHVKRQDDQKKAKNARIKQNYVNLGHRLLRLVNFNPIFFRPFSIFFAIRGPLYKRNGGYKLTINFRVVKQLDLDGFVITFGDVHCRIRH